MTRWVLVLLHLCAIGCALFALFLLATGEPVLAGAMALSAASLTVSALTLRSSLRTLRRLQ